MTRNRSPLSWNEVRRCSMNAGPCHPYRWPGAKVHVQLDTDRSGKVQGYLKRTGSLTYRHTSCIANAGSQYSSTIVFIKTNIFKLDVDFMIYIVIKLCRVYIYILLNISTHGYSNIQYLSIFYWEKLLIGIHLMIIDILNRQYFCLLL